MSIDLKKWAPWNWFKKEQDTGQGTSRVPVARSNVPVTFPSTSLDPVLRLHREVDRLFDDVLRGFGVPWPNLMLPTATSEWQAFLRPALDIQETDKQYRITLEAPGVEQKDIQITLDDDVLWIRGEKRQEEEREDARYRCVERSYGNFQRALNLPEDADQDAIKASFRNGVLTITIDKRSSVTPQRGRSIPING